MTTYSMVPFAYLNWKDDRKYIIYETIELYSPNQALFSLTTSN